MTTPTEERLELAPDPRSVRAARSFVGDLLRRWGLDDVVDTAVLLTSELATNAVRHAGTRYAVVVARTADGVRVDVLDRDDRSPEERMHDLDADSGRGLQLVAGVASSWGATPTSDLHGYTKGVRFSLRAAAAGSRRTSRVPGAPSAAR